MNSAESLCFTLFTVLKCEPNTKIPRTKNALSRFSLRRKKHTKSCEKLPAMCSPYPLLSLIQNFSLLWWIGRGNTKTAMRTKPVFVNLN